MFVPEDFKEVTFTLKHAKIICDNANYVLATKYKGVVDPSTLENVEKPNVKHKEIMSKLDLILKLVTEKK